MTAGPSPSAAAPGASEPGGLSADRQLILGLVGLAIVAFAIRLIAVMRGAGLGGNLGFDDGVYFSSAMAFIAGRVPYLDFNLLHPPGIIYLLSPFAALGGITTDGNAFAVARLAFMALGALNTILVGLVGRSISRTAAIWAAAIYAVWIVPATVEQTTWLVGPQTTLLLLALLQLGVASSHELTIRRVALAGILLGAAGAVQLWTAVPAVVVLLWLLVVSRRDLRAGARRALAYCVGGVVAAAVIAGPALVASGGRMFQLIVVTQLSRNTGEGNIGLVDRIRLMEGIPPAGRLARIVPDPLALLAFAAIAVVFAWVAWKQPRARLWVALLAAKFLFLMYTAVFYRHYTGWLAPEAALLGGVALAMGTDALARFPRRVAVAGALVVLLAVAAVAMRSAGHRVPLSPGTPDLAQARCVTADAPLLLIVTDIQSRNLERGCPVLLNPGGLSNILNAEIPGPPIPRHDLVEYQQAMRDWYTAGDAALFNRLVKDAFASQTWAAIQEALPVHRQIGGVTVLRREQP